MSVNHSHQYFVPFSCRNSKSYIKAVEDLTHLSYLRVRNGFHQNNTIYSLSSNGCSFYHACQIAHKHTGSVLSHLQSLFLYNAHPKYMIVSLRLSPPGPSVGPVTLV